MAAKKMAFDVEVCRTEKRTATFRVRATSREEAEEKAIEESFSFNFRDGSFCCADEEVVSIKEAGVGQPA